MTPSELLDRREPIRPGAYIDQWPASYFHGYHGPRGYAGPNGVLGPWHLPSGFSYTGEVKKGLTKAQDGGTWGISCSGSWGPYQPVLMAPPHLNHYEHLKQRQREEGHKAGLAGPGDSPKADIWVLVHENSSPMTWLENRIKIMRAKLSL